MAKKKSKSQHPSLYNEVLDILKHNESKLLNYRQIATMLEITEESDRLYVIEALEQLLLKDLVHEKEPGKFQYKSGEMYVNGIIDFVSTGGAYVVTSPTEKDIFIAKGKTKDALHGDTVKVMLNQSFDKRQREGIIAQVIQRKRTDFVGIAQVNAKNCFVVPDSNKLHVDFFIPLSKTKGVKNGQKVLVKLTSWSAGESNPIVHIQPRCTPSWLSMVCPNISLMKLKRLLKEFLQKLPKKKLLSVEILEK